MTKEMRDLDDGGYISLASVIFDFFFLLAMIALGVYIFVRSVEEWPLFGIIITGFLMVSVAISAPKAA